MYKSFILSIKYDQSTCTLFKIFLKVIILCLDIIYQYIETFIFLLVNIFIEYFVGNLQPYLTSDNGAKDVDKNAYIQATTIKNTYAKDICAKSTYIRNAFSTRNVYIKGISIKNAFVKGIYYIRGIFVRGFCSFSIIEYWKINLQSFKYLEVKNNKLEI